MALAQSEETQTAEGNPPSPRPIIAENASKIVWALAWPAVALNSLQVINNLLDRAFLGRLDESAIIAHGGAMNVMFLWFSLAMSLGTASTALVARAFGAKRPFEYRRAHRQTFGLALVGGILAAGLSMLLSGPLSGFILGDSNPSATREMAKFVMYFSLGLPGMFVVQVLAGSLRGIGDTRSPMVISGIQILVHVILNFLLISPDHRFGPVFIDSAGLGLAGAGISLSASAWLAALVYVLYLKWTPLGQAPIRLPSRPWVVRILRIAVPAGIMSTIRVLSFTFFTVALARVPNGDDAIGALSVAIAVESIMFMPTFGLSIAATSLVGQSLGARNPERAGKLGWVAAHWGALVTLLMCVPIFVFAEAVPAALLPGKPEMVAMAADLLRWLCLTEVLFAYSMVLMGAMQGAGDTVRPLWIAVISLWGLRVPLAYFMALGPGAPLGAGLVMPVGLAMGAHGAWIAMSITQAIQGFLSMAVYQQGGWKLKKV